MTKKEMCTESVSRNGERMQKYKEFAVAFSYPVKDGLKAEYDRFFRAKEVWLYTTEYLAKNESQRSNYLSDITGFYKAFGVEPDKNRPDSLSSELEFMYYLIFKMLYALKDKDKKDRVDICLEAQKKFFAQHLYPAAKEIVGAIRRKSEENFYTAKAGKLLEFLDREKIFLGDAAC